MTHWARTVACLLLLLCPFAVPARADVPPDPPIGVNLEGLSDYMAADMLVDLAKTGRRFGDPGAPHKNGPGTIRLDEKGWPLEDAGVVLRAAEPRPYPQRFRYAFDGRARLVFFPRSVQLTESRHDPATGRSTGTFVLPTGEGTLFLSFLDTDGGIRNLQVLRDVEAVGSFTKQFIDRLAPFRGKVLRMMDLQGTNNSEQATWDHRSTPDSSGFHRVLPVELLVELANTLEADPWFCMPHLADDGYVRGFAGYVRDHVPVERTVYVEHSNEVWNSQFGQSRYAMQAGERQGLGSGNEARLRYHGKRTAEIGRIWREAFSQEPRHPGLVVVLGAQAANPYTARAALETPGVADAVDAIAIAPYLGGAFGSAKTADEIARLSVDELLDRVEEEFTGKLATWLRDYAAFARERGKRLLAYEAGQHLVGHGGADRNEALTDLFIAANRHPRMADLYTRYLDTWFAHSDDVVCLFAFTSRPRRSGSWGLIENLDQPSEQAPKFLAVERYLDQH